MFKAYKDICDVVSLFVYCPSDRTFLVVRDVSGEYWLPCGKSERHCWKGTASKIFVDIFASETASQACTPFRIFKVWLPLHQFPSVFHAVYKISVKSDVRKKIKSKGNSMKKVSWFNSVELERQRIHATLKSAEIIMYMQLIFGEVNKEDPIWAEFDMSIPLFEVTEDIVFVNASSDTTTAATDMTNLLQAANYSKDDQLHLYREFTSLSFPAIFMSPQIFTTFMVDLGWQKQQCPGLFRQYDCNRDGKIEYEEFKELMAAARLARKLTVDALSVAKDTDVCLKSLGYQPNSPLQLSEFLRLVADQRLRGTSGMIRSPRSVSAYLVDLHDRNAIVAAQSKGHFSQPMLTPAGGGAETSVGPRLFVQPDYSVATFTMRVGKANEMMELQQFSDDAVSPSTVRLLEVAGVNAISSNEVLGPSTFPVEAMAAVRYFAAPVDKLYSLRRTSGTSTAATNSKNAWAWANPSEEVAMGNLLLKLADGVKQICQAEPRLLRLNSPVYVVGDLHGNLSALLSIEAALWPSGAALSPAKLLFLGDFVDRGPHGCELMAYLMASKLQRPKGVFLIRGNHETRDIQKMFTFYTECITKYGEVEGNKIWSIINQVYDVLPLAAVVDDKVFCCHGGIPPPWVCPLISAIDKIPVPLTRPAEQSTIAWELLWNDPVKPNKMTATLSLELSANEGFAVNSRRGTGHVFDQSAIDRFLVANQLSHIVRAHEMHPTGFMCQLRGRLVSVFSSSHYCGGNNESGVVLLEGNKLRLIRVDTV